MNLASWIILGVVVVIVGFAIKATFFKKKARGGCCDTGDAPIKAKGSAVSCNCASASSCSGCSACEGSATARNAVLPTYKPIAK